jgi:hypothetical protein
MSTRESRAERASDGASQSSSILDVLDVVAKLLTAAALLIGGYIAHSFESRMTGTTLLSQREEAETSLRASMLNSLIEPIIGKDKGVVDPDRERLLVELLALNFHEHFELKPLMERVDQEFAAKPPTGMSKEEALTARYSLWSVAHRVSSQQVASLIREQAGAKFHKNSCRLYQITITTAASSTEQTECQAKGAFGEKISVQSPDGKYTLNVFATELDLKNQTLQLTTTVQSAANEGYDLAYSFKLSWFSFPMTDNTLLPDGNRFAMSLDNIRPDKSAVLRVVWFPKDYFTPRERPLDYRQMLKLVGKEQE